MFSSPKQYSGTQKSIQVVTELLQKVSTHSGLSIDNGCTVYNFMDQELLRNSEYFLPDPTEIPSNESIEAHLFLIYKLRICSLQIIFLKFSKNILTSVPSNSFNSSIPSYIFGSLYCISKRENLWNKEKCFLFNLKISFCSWDNQILNF